MVFSSLEFLAWFLPFFMAIYFLLPDKLKNTCLFLFSIVFYAYGTVDKPFYVALLLVSVLANYLMGIIIDNSRHRRAMLVVGLIFNFGILFVFKYLDFFIGNVNYFLKEPLPYANLVLPIGISFFTFQVASYLIDVYRGEVCAEKNILNLGTYIFMFPQLIAGPIVRYSNVSKALKERSYSKELIFKGISEFILGLGFKVLLANRIGSIWTSASTIGYESLSTPMAWLGIIAYSLQIYFDFYGYSLMAMGLGHILGFDLPVNFRHPYVSTSMTEFWRRWHITLGGWFKEYVYIPLGGSLNGKGRTYFNLLVVWLLTGFWHGADWNFIIWGLFLFIVISIEKSGLLNLLNRHRLIGHIYMLLLIPLSWLIFSVGDVSSLADYCGRLIGIGGSNVFPGDYLKYLESYWPFLAAGIVLCTELPEKLFYKISNRLIRGGILALILAASVYCIYKGMNDPFLYFRF